MSQADEPAASSPPPDWRRQEVRWVQEARDGSTEAFEQLLNHYERPVLYFLRRLIGAREAALDAHQEVWLEAFRGLRRLRKPELFGPWLYRIARNKAARHVRSLMREATSIEDPDETRSASSPVMDDPAVDPQEVHWALDQLSVTHREVLTLHYLQDFSLEEIAIALECPVGTVKSRLFHGRLAMRTLLERKSPSCTVRKTRDS